MITTISVKLKWTTKDLAVGLSSTKIVGKNRKHDIVAHFTYLLW